MKRLVYLMIIGATVATISCKKSSTPEPTVTPYQLTATRVANVARKQPDTFSVNNTSSATVVWKVVPPAGVWYSHSGNKAYIRFSNPGTYKVYASAGSNFDSTIINVDSTIYNGDTTLPGTTLPMDSTLNNDSTTNPNGSNDTIVALSGSLSITPSVVSDSVNGATGASLVLTAITSQSYPNANPQLVDSVWYQTNQSNTITGLTIFYADVFLPGGVSTTSSAKASKTDYLSSLSNGTYSLTIILSGTTYTGSFVKNGNTYTFTWTNGSVAISPLTVTL